MLAIPVIDLKGGLVVGAKAGERARYSPLKTPLAASSEPVEVARGLLALHRFRALYIADLDAIEGATPNHAAIAAIAETAAGVELWVDNGIADLDAARAWLTRGVGRLVIGSESQAGPATLKVLKDARVALSLDFRSDRFLGPPALLAEPERWPERVIVMTLARVGAERGPDMARLAEIAGRAPAGTRVFAAGGVRGAEDLAALDAVGISGALIASSLHSGALGPVDLARFDA